MTFYYDYAIEFSSLNNSIVIFTRQNQIQVVVVISSIVVVMKILDKVVVILSRVVFSLEGKVVVSLLVVEVVVD